MVNVSNGKYQQWRMVRNLGKKSKQKIRNGWKGLYTNDVQIFLTPTPLYTKPYNFKDPPPSTSEFANSPYKHFLCHIGIWITSILISPSDNFTPIFTSPTSPREEKFPSWIHISREFVLSRESFSNNWKQKIKILLR